MNFTYTVISNNEARMEGTGICYGIAAENGGEVLDMVCDITSDWDEISNLVDKCNRNKLSLVHMRDVVEDFILSR